MQVEPLLEVRNLGKRAATRGWWSAGEGRWIIRGISFRLERGRTLALIGPSGAGKTTLARCLAQLETPDEGEAMLNGRAVRIGDIQLIPQQPAASFNPRFTAIEALTEPLEIRRSGNRASWAKVAAEWMERVGVSPGYATKPVRQFSGGEIQRLAIARALTLRPRLLILDESLASLDDASRSQVVELLKSLQSELGVTYIVAGHDLETAGSLADEIAVMADGGIVEHRSAKDLLESPQHPRTRELVMAERELYSGVRWP